jgi:hypothetical protein
MRLLNRFFPATVPCTVGATGAPARVFARHAGVLRRCAGERETALVVAAVDRTVGSARHPFGRHARRDILLLTRNRLVVTTQCRFLRRLRLYLSVDPHQLTDVTWTPEPEFGLVRLAATAVDGVREHFVIRLGDAARVARVDELFREVFHAGVPVAHKAPKRAGKAAAAQPRPVTPALLAA